MLLDVVEHIEKDIAFLQQIIQSVNSATEIKMLVSVPAYQGLFTGHDVFLKHYRRYTRKSISQTIIAAGLVPVRTGYFFFLAFTGTHFSKTSRENRSAPKAKRYWQLARFSFCFKTVQKLSFI
ncbi:MAG: hypothetical protein WDO71_03820 [Bacteroidota bacterium]